jgi:hypothetical protein
MEFPQNLYYWSKEQKLKNVLSREGNVTLLQLNQADFTTADSISALTEDDDNSIQFIYVQIE